MTGLQQRLESGLAGRYTLERELGHGGMAIVFLSPDLRHDRRVALKVLRPEISVSVSLRALQKGSRDPFHFLG